MRVLVIPVRAYNAALLLLLLLLLLRAHARIIGSNRRTNERNEFARAHNLFLKIILETEPLRVGWVCLCVWRGGNNNNTTRHASSMGGGKLASRAI